MKRKDSVAEILKVTDVPPSLNKVLQMHWAKRRRLLDAWIWMIRAAWERPEVCQSKMKVKVTLFHSRLYDKDNAYGACKVIFDAFKATKLIVNDSPEWLEATVLQEKCPHKQRHTIIELEACDGK